MGRQWTFAASGTRYFSLAKPTGPPDIAETGDQRRAQYRRLGGSAVRGAIGRITGFCPGFFDREGPGGVRQMVTFRRRKIGWLALLGVGVAAVNGAVSALVLVTAADAEPVPGAGILPALAPAARMIEVADAAAMSRTFSDLGYHLAGVRRAGEVPRISVAKLPGDLVGIEPAEERKSLFLLAILPLVLQANEDILADRARLLTLDATPRAEWTDGDGVWFGQLAAAYKADTLEEPVRMDELIRRVDIVPTSLALAQAAAESGWGTSRFAIEANAIFGQWTTLESQGLRPSGADQGSNYYIRAFDAPGPSVAAYMRNLNTHDAYVSFRNRRQHMRNYLGDLAALGLANTLLPYSQQGQDYIDTIRTIIESNALTAYDQVQLRRRSPDPAREI